MSKDLTPIDILKGDKKIFSIAVDNLTQDLEHYLEHKDFFYEIIKDQLPSNIADSNYDAKDQINQTIISLTNNFQSDFLKSEIIRLVAGKKKLLRPRLYLTNGSNYELAAAMELFHLATLMQDDVIDQANYRRFLKTTNNLYDNRTAVLSSDLLLIEILTIVKTQVELDLKDLDESIDNKKLSDFVFSTFKLVITQMIESEEQAKFVNDLDSYNDYVIGKTGNLFGLCYMLGFLKQDVDIKDLRAKFNLGVEFGVVFQKIDDYLDAYSDIDITGKDQLDNVNGIKNFVVLMGNNQQKSKNIISDNLAKFLELTDFKDFALEIIGGINE